MSPVGAMQCGGPGSSTCYERYMEVVVTEASVRHPDKTVTVATFGDYLTAHRAVDYLSDNKFPVHVVSIIGEDRRSAVGCCLRCDRARYDRRATGLPLREFA
jgi:hypothetical protein